MAINVNFYQLAKKENSTLQPTGSGNSYTCVLKDSCSIENPEIELNAKPTNWYNYAYIADFNRYYYVTNWSYFRGIWTAELKVDVLASFKTTIGSTTKYVLRSAHSYDKEIKDTLYPLKSETVKMVSSGTLYNWATNFSGGTFIAYINNGNVDSGYGSLNYMYFTPTQFGQLLNALYPTSTDTYHDVFTTDVYNIFAGVLLNPIDFITKVFWVPVTLTAGSLPTTFGNYVALTGNNQPVYHGNLSSYKQTQTLNLTVPKRSDTVRGAWANTSPFGTYYLYYAPFGIIALDSNHLIGANSIDIVSTLDLTTGELKISIYTIGDYGSVLDRIYSGTSRVGVEIPVDKAKSEGIQTLETLLGVGSVVVDTLTGNYAGAVADITGTIGSMGEAPPKSGGPSTGLNALEDTVYLYYEYFEFADEDNVNRGRPLCQNVQLSTVPGYILCAEGNVGINGTSNEQEQIKQYLERGFYYE